MNRLTMKLPWPDKGLSPNSRLHWAARSKIARQYRETCWKEALAWGANRFKAETLHVHLEFYPPDRRKRDDDNMVASFKAGRDGVAAALGIDDALWNTTYAFPKETGGYIIATLSDRPVMKTVEVA